MVDLSEKIIEIYNNNKEKKDDKGNGKESDNSNNKEQNHNKDKEDGKLSTKFIALMELIILVLIFIFSVLFYFIGKNLNKLRKRKANELNDEYDYTSAEQSNSINNITEKK